MYKRLTERIRNHIVVENQTDALERLAELEDKIERGELVENTVVTYVNMARTDSKTLIDKALKFDELKAKIENGTLKEVDNKVYPPNTSIGVWGDYCSKCGGLIGENGYEENYCSHCGAKLKE